MGNVRASRTTGVGWSLGCVLQSCEDTVEGGLEADHLGLHDLGVRMIRIRPGMHKKRCMDNGYVPHRTQRKVVITVK
jgi:hypothetical protein